MRRNLADSELAEFLTPSELCDIHHPLVKATAEKVADGARTKKAASVRVFHFVRDEIPLAFVHPWKTASETLKMQKGSCLTKATLQVSLLRSLKIPARFRIMEFKGNDPKEWKGIVPSFAVSRMPERWPHYFAEVYVKNRWVMADATFDKALVLDTEDWDGEKDVVSIEKSAVLSDLGYFQSIEDAARKLDGMYRNRVLWTMNTYKFLWVLNLYLKMQRLSNKFRL